MARPLNEEQLLPLLRTLADGAWHSGETLAQEAGITRAGLSKRLQKLMQWNLEIETQPGRGCRLAHPLELLDADLIRGALPPAWQGGLGVRVLAGTDSTNTQLLAADAADDPQALLAEHQSAGRGRHGRSWHSPFGTNLYLSLAWTFPQWPPGLTALPLATGVATAEALAELELPGLRLKWPNDLWCGDAKLGGILIEQRGESGGACRVVIGLGLNVAMRSATTAHIGQPWTTLAEALRKVPSRGIPSRNQLAGRILAHWAAMLQRFARDGFAPFEPRWRALDLLRNRAVLLALPDGELDGIARGVDEAGALLVDVGEARRRILSGEVSLRVTPQ
jgi:BirA family transcriptional regulator, biotin operon repressor / biotin---[acetyl-CoA-carboxylase] ligase